MNANGNFESNISYLKKRKSVKRLIIKSAAGNVLIKIETAESYHHLSNARNNIKE